MRIVDFRSDTVTLPTPEMLKGMVDAKVGDDVFSDDPSVNMLEEKAAKIMGKEAAVFVASGTMGNLVSVLAHCERGGEIILGDQYELYGRGLSFYTFQDQNIDYNNSLKGITLNYFLLV